MNWINHIRHPFDQDRLRLLAQRLSHWPAKLNTPNQSIGRYAVGCGATMGVHERCNFGCTACYLGKDANQQPPLPFEEVEQQLKQLRQWLGPGGNVQITSGEVTLLPLEDLQRIVRAAVDNQLSPMVMTHGDVVLHDPDYLDGLVAAGMRKISIHVDITQRGRKGMSREDFEKNLNTVRDQMAEMLRACRQRTGIKLKAATTLTINQHNLKQLPDAVHWLLGNLDAFRLMSFQPQARTGRTHEDDGADAGEVWTQLEAAMGMTLEPHAFMFGHPDCNRIALILAIEGGSKPIYIPAVRPDNPVDKTFLGDLLKDFGGLVLADRSAGETVRRLLGALLRKPGWIPRVLGYALKRTWQERAHLPSALGALLRFRLKLRPFAFVVHAFMDADMLTTPIGEERIESCVFKVPVNGEMVSMCQLNGSSLREETYQDSGAMTV